MEPELLAACYAGRVNIELMVGYDADGELRVGVRFRPWQQPKKGNVMIIAAGADLLDALGNAVTKAEAGRWEALDYTKRPWVAATRLNNVSWAPDNGR